jgi:hypothetical protein
MERDLMTLAAFSRNAQSDSQGGRHDRYHWGRRDRSGTTDQDAVPWVAEGGSFGTGAEQLYIPLHAEKNITPNESVTFKCAKARAESLYIERPGLFDNT